jgi:K(+)-stimulated pyrophosphate-energized sodium pump
MQKIALAVQEGGRAFLHAEYKWLAVFVVVVFVPRASARRRQGAVPRLEDGDRVPLGSTVASAAAGYFGMHCATRAAVRTTQAAKTSLGGALDVAFKSGTVMGMTVVGLGLLGITC